MIPDKKRYARKYKSRMMLRKIKEFFVGGSINLDEKLESYLRIKNCYIYYDCRSRDYILKNQTIARQNYRFSYWEDVVKHLHYIMGYPFAYKKFMRWAEVRRRGERKNNLYYPERVKRLVFR